MNRINQAFTTQRFTTTASLTRLLTGVTLLLMTIAGCQTYPTYQAYAGPAKANSEIATVFIPKEFNLLNVNGDSYTQPLIGQGTKVKLLPGSHKIVIKYVDFWFVTADMQEKVKSQPMLVAFDAQAGHTYRIQFRELKSVTEARAFAQNPDISLIDESGKTQVAADIQYHLEDKGLIAAFLDSEPASAPSPTPEAKGEPALEMLKYWWQKASAQQQEDFMKWVVEK